MKRIFSILILLVLLTQVDTYAKKVKQLTPTITWELKKDGTLKISGTGKMPTMSRDKYPWAKKANKITAVHISEGITKIGDESFYNEYYSKKKYQISNIYLPSTLKNIGVAAFKNCGSISSLKIPNGITSIKKSSFEKCGIKTLKLPSTLQYIGEDAFANNDIISLAIPKGVKDIKDGAFRDNNITSLTIPEEVKTLGASAFESCRIKTLTINSKNLKKIGNCAFKYNGIISLSISIEEIGDEAFCGNPISSLTLTENVKIIGKRAFAGNSIKELSIPNTVKTIGKDAFVQYNGTSYCPYKGNIVNLPEWIKDKHCELIGISHTSIDKYRGPRAKDLFHKGNQYFNKNDYETALQYYRKGTVGYEEGEHKYQMECWWLLAFCYNKLGDEAKALECYEKAGMLGHSNARSGIGLIGHRYYDKQDFQKALKFFEIANKYGDETTMIRLTKERLTEIKEIDNLLKSGHYNQAFNIVCKNPTDKFTDHKFNIVSNYLIEKKDYSNAIKLYKQLYDKNHNAALVDQIAAMYLNLKDYTNAAEYYSIGAQAGDKEAQYKLGQVYEKANNKNLAIFWYKKAAEQKHLKAEEALAHYGVFITTPSQANSQNSGTNASTTSSKQNSSTTQGNKTQTSTYTPEYGFRDVWVQCAQCHGSGKCWSCHGEGWCVSTRSDGSYNSTYKCPICNGTGNCTTCFGTGGHYEKQQYQIR